MREVNFSIPNVNKASVGITTALYDRRALDCTSTLPLINSLNHLAYLTTSSARIRDILTIDGGVERLVCILKQGRSREMMEMWKWNLAFQCVVNIGVRGSENVRTRVVEADMVPVIATILDNYIRVIDKLKEKAEGDSRRRSLQSLQTGQTNQALTGLSRASCPRQTFQSRENPHSEPRPVRRHDPPTQIDISHTTVQTFPQSQASGTSDPISTDLAPTMPPQPPLLSPTDRSPFSRLRHHHHHHHHHHHQTEHRNQNSRYHVSGSNNHTNRNVPVPPFANAAPSMDAGDVIALRPVRDADRLPSMLPPLQTGMISQPESPTTPSAPLVRSLIPSTRSRRRPSIRQQLSHSGDSDDANGDEAVSDASGNNDNLDEPMVDIQPDVDFQEGEGRESLLEDVSVAATITIDAPNVSEGQEMETFNITHQSANDGSIINANLTPPNNDMTFSPPTQPMNVASIGAHGMPQNAHSQYLLQRSAPPGVLAATPRDEDVLMSLQLLAYVSKYCNLRSYFQQSHLVPKLKIGDKLKTFDDCMQDQDCEKVDGDAEEEYLLADDFNIFPLVEKFTVRHHSQDMQHWAGVVMRNLCRKDDARGGIRQCAYYECGKWEQWQRQFAKCRRCRRTKYCSKECQKNAWVSTCITMVE